MVLSLSPAIVLVATYWRVSSAPVGPYGGWKGRKIRLWPWAAWACFVGFMMSGPIAQGDAAETAVVGALMYGGPWMLLEGQRRLRRRRDPDAWTDPLLDGLRLHWEVVLPAAVADVGLAILLSWDGSLTISDVDVLLGPWWVAAYFLYQGVISAPSDQVRGQADLTFGYWIAGMLVLVVPVDVLRLAYLALGTVLVVAYLERVRRRTIAQRLHDLDAAGLGPAVDARYGPTIWNPRRFAPVELAPGPG